MVAKAGDAVLLGQQLVNVTWWGYVTDIDTPTGMLMTMEAVGDEGSVTTDALVGPKGNPGKDSTPCTLLWDADVTEVDDLPTDFNDTSDVNSGFWINAEVYVWTGTTWVARNMGSAGPVGPVPDVEPTVESISWEDQENGEVSSIDITGTPENPGWHFKIAAPRGPKGENSRIRESADYDDTLPPTGMQVITWDVAKSKYRPMDSDPLATLFYSVPESAFTNFSGIAQRQLICTFDIPPQPFDWVPYVTGHIKATGLELDTDPLTIGSEVRIGDATTGQLIGRGFGDNTMWTIVSPHFSTPNQPSDAVTPDGGVARIPANHSGNEGKIYMNLYNDGLAGIYNFNKAGAQLAIQIIPV